MRKYAKKPIPVTAKQQTKPFSVKVDWQKEPLQGGTYDWLITDGGKSRPVAADIFADTYEHLGGDQYVKVGTVMAVQMDEPFVVTTLEGSAQGKAGDYLVQGPAGEAWPIRRDTFETTYLPSEESG